MSGADQSAVGSNVISTPSGGGSMSGMGETFSPNPFTGTGNFSVPLAVLPGRNGLQPSLTLGYSTGNGNTEFGWGMSIGIPSITRQTRKGVPTYQEDEDLYILSGAEDLIEITKENRDGYIVRSYQPRTEGLFARIERYVNGTSDYWKIWSKDGMISIYGSDASSDNTGSSTQRLATDSAAGGSNPYACVDPGNEKRIFEWKLNRTIDIFGNYIQYNYKRDTIREDKYHNWEKLYLDTIQYIDFQDDTDNTHFLASVQFEYQERPDPFSKYNTGFEIRTIQRCKKINVLSHPKNETTNLYQDILSKSYTLFYADEQVKTDRLDPIHLFVNGASSLTSIQTAGHDGDKVEYLPPITFRYSQFESKGKTFEKINSKAPLGYIGTQPNLQFVDLFGNGLPDILQLGGGQALYWENRGNGEFTAPRTMKDAPSGISLGQEGVALVDTNGNGRIDLQVNSGTLPGYYPLTFNGTFDRKSFKRFNKVPSFSVNDPEVKFIDLDGDGATDILRNGQRFECFFLDQETGYDRTAFINKKTLENFPNVSFSDPRVKLADMTGDGLSDIVFINSGSIVYWPNLGYGRFGRKVVMKNSPKFPTRDTTNFLYLLTNSQILLGDIDGDGVNDLVFVDNGKTYFYINQGGNSWSEPIKKSGTPPLAGASLQMLDLKGKGSAGLAFIYPPGFGGRNGAQMYYLDLLGTEGEKPYQLIEMDNNMGARTRVRYRSSVVDYLRDQKDKNSRWQTKLPFPTQVVAKTEVIDFISQNKLVTEYNYHHGYWDGDERSFIGFGRVDQVESESFVEYNKNTQFEARKEKFGTPNAYPLFQQIEDSKTHYSPPLETRSWFHLGAVENPEDPFDWAELFFENEYWQGDRQLLSLDNEEKNFIKGLPRRARRDYYRTKRGSVLRTELYAQDRNRSGLSNRPYTVTETLTHAKLIHTPTQEAKELRKKRLGSGYIFFSFQKGSRTTQWERGNQPMTQISFTEDYDPFGNPQKSISFALPKEYQAQSNKYKITDTITDKVFATLNITEFVHRDDADKYLIGRSIAQKSYEIVNTGNLSIAAVRQELKNKTAQEIASLSPSSFSNLQLISHALSYYDGSAAQAFQGLPYGQLGDYGVPTRSETLCITDSELTQAYSSDIPFYLTHSGNNTPAAYYPQSFQDALTAATEHSPVDNKYIGYDYHDGSDHHLQGFYCQADRKKYDFQSGAPTDNHKGLVLEMMDPRGNVAAVSFDQYNFLPLEVTDPFGNKTTSQYDYRILQAHKITDANDNESRFRFSALGFLEATYILGSGAPTGGSGTSDLGDVYGSSLEDPTDSPSVRYEYDFFNFKDNFVSNAAQLNTRFPIYVKTTARENHKSANINDLTICTVEYSDGFGRMIQTRTQAEETTFGNAPDTTIGDNATRIVNANSGLATSQESTDTNAIGYTNPSSSQVNVIVSGWQVYDNKGRVIEKYEPFYAQGFDFETPIDTQLNYTNGIQGKKVRMYYDPRGQVIRTVNPNNTQQWVLFGKPLNEDITQPNNLYPTPWESYTYDANDLASITADPLNEDESGLTPSTHHFTPSSSEIDPLGRTIKTIDRNDTAGQEQIVMQYQYDIRGNLTKTTDALDREAFVYLYDTANRPLKVTHIDGGDKWTIYNAANQPIETRDQKGAITLYQYDQLNRPLKVWARDNADETITLRQEYTYGEEAAGFTELEKKAKNYIGKLVEQKDESGICIFDNYDFKGNLLQKTKQVISDDAVNIKLFTLLPLPASVYNPTVDWDPNNGNISLADLDSKEFKFNSEYDALNRVTQMTLPEDMDSERKVFTTDYNRSGALESVTLDGTKYIDRIAYNARGQRILMALGNNTMTRYAYDDTTFWLKRLKTEKYTKDETIPNQVHYQKQAGTTLQDFAYQYDLSGNIRKITDATTGAGYNGSATPDKLERDFSYDAIYRLLTATGREQAGTNLQPWNDTYRSNDVTATRAYTRTYAYDKMGNILEQRHTTNEENGLSNFTKNFNYNSNKNTLNHYYHELSGLLQFINRTYTHDVNGNIIKEGENRHFDWDAGDNLRAFYIDAGEGTTVTKYARYLYDSSGNRVKKLVRGESTSNYTSTTYIDGVFEYTKKISNNGATTEEQTLIHVLDGSSRIAILRQGDDFGDTTAAIKYCHEDHLGNGSLYSDSTGSLINREEYYPFGGTSFGSYSKKRYRYNGKEKDEESGLYYYGMRYYAPWMCRFVSVDPLASEYKQLTPYQYSSNDPVNHVDIDGMERDDQPKDAASTTSNGNSGSSSGSTSPNNTTEQVKSLEERLKSANQQIDKFEKGDTESAFKGLDKEAFVGSLRNVVSNPDSLKQCQGTMDCGIFASMNVLAEMKPDELVTAAISLYSTGETTTSGGATITASDFIKENYSQAAKKFNIDPTVYVLGYSLRDQQNTWMDFNLSGYWSSTSSGTMESWLTDVYGFGVSSPSDGYNILTEGLDSNQLKGFVDQVSEENPALLLVNSQTFKTGKTHPKGFYGNHFIVISQAKLNAKKDSVTIDVYDYGLDRPQTFGTNVFQSMINSAFLINR